MHSRSIFTETELSSGAVDVVIRHFPATNLALTHNRIPVVAQVEARNRSLDEQSVAFTIEATLESLEGEEIAPVEHIPVPALGPGASHITTDRGYVRPAHAAVVGRTESYPANLTARIVGGSGTGSTDLLSALGTASDRLEASPEFRILAENEWFNSPAFYESLAAFIQPNTPEVNEVLKVAARLLDKQTGDSSLQGYQQGNKRAATITLAIYEALKTRGIDYITPPASFENTGQRVRSTVEVLQTGFGTCIDLSVTYAACCEAAGLNPVVLIVHGHAMAGIMLNDVALSSPVLYEQGTIRNLSKSDDILPVDAVFYGPDSFRQAVSRAKDTLAGTNVYGLVDVSASRSDDIRPLPTHHEIAGDVAPSTEARESAATDAEAWALPGLGGLDDDIERAQRHDDSPPRVQRWKQTLLDMSFRNRLLSMRATRDMVPLLLPEDGLTELDDLVHAGRTIELRGSDAVTDNRKLQGYHSISELPREQVLEDLTDGQRAYVDITERRYRNQLRGLARQVQTLYSETGSGNLYLTLGSMTIRNSTGGTAEAPLFLVPVRITGGKGNSRFGIVVDSSVEASPNHCLIEWLRDRHDAAIPSLEEPPLDSSGLDINRAIADISRTLTSLQLPFEVRESSFLGIFQFSTYGMWRDLDENWADLNRSPVFRHLVERSGASFVDEADPTDLRDLVVDEESLTLPIPADGAQMQAIEAAAKGRTFVLEGPPGTGKSQTITNLIVHSMLAGRTMLFVAEKQAALDVVQRRLRQVGLADFTLDLHGEEQKPANIRKQLKDSIELDVTYEDRIWRTICDRYSSRLRPLAEYPSRIHGENSAGMSLWSAVTNLDATGEGPVLPVEEKVVTDPEFDEAGVEAALRDFERLARDMPPGSSPEWSLVGPGAVDVSDATLQAAVERVHYATAGLPGPLRDELSRPRTGGVASPTAVLAPLVSHLEELHSHGEVPSETLNSGGSRELSTSYRDLAAKVTDFQTRLTPLRAIVPDDPLRTGDFRSATIAAASIDDKFLGKKKRRAALQEQLSRLVADPTQIAPEAVGALASDVESARAEMSALENQINQLPGSLFGRSSLDPELSDDLRTEAAKLDVVADSIDAQAGFASEHPRMRSLIAEHGIGHGDVASIRECEQAWGSLSSLLDTSGSSLADWVGEQSWVDRVSECVEVWRSELADRGGASVRDTARLKAALQPLRVAGMHTAVRALLDAEIPAQDITSALQRGLAETSIRERSRAAGLENFSATSRDGEVEEFIRAAKRMREEAPDALAARLLERRPFRAGRLDGEFGELARQLTAKRGALPFRRLMERYRAQITAIAPCLFVSPSSLSKFVPADGELFDMVVFDEASQVPVDQAVGALGRARSAIIVGDSQQMPPTRFAQASLTFEEDFDPDVEAEIVPVDLESILTESVESGVPRLWLTWHYRSQDERLIAFSNNQYYEGNLSSLPTPGGEADAGIELLRVEGHFYRKGEIPRGGLVDDVTFRHAITPATGTNPLEAEAVVDEIHARLNDPALSSQSIAVVTFNITQRDLILDALEASDDPLVRARLDDEVDPLVVKNLENVQGDERDVILFSTAFSPRAPGGPLPLNFGPLNQSGGERRLNVAVTRARRKVVVFSSFDASDIDLSRTNAKGLADLRGYLESAGEVADDEGHNARVKNLVRDRISDELKSRGYEVSPEYGLSEFTVDLAVRHPGSERWECAVLLDGPRWEKLPTVADREGTPDLLSGMMGWATVKRVWLPEWHHRPGRVIDSIVSALDKAAVDLARRDAELEELRQREEERLAAERERLRLRELEDAEHPEQSEQSGQPSDSGQRADDDDTVVWSEPDEVAPTTSPQQPSPRAEYTPATAVAGSTAQVSVEDDLGSTPPVDSTPLLTVRSLADKAQSVRIVDFEPVVDEALGTPEDLVDPPAAPVRARITERLNRVIAAEAPLTQDELARRIANCFGVQRVSQRIRDIVLANLSQSLVRSSHGEDFVWPVGAGPDTYTVARNGTGRSLHDTPLEEIANAMAALRVDELGSDEARFRATLQFFGQKRLTASARQRLEEAWERATNT